MKKEIEKVEPAQGEEKIILKSGKVYLFFKRVFDIFLSFLAIVLLSWLLIILVLLVVCTSKGHAFFIDYRVGLHGKTIKVLKFRSMYSDAESHIEKYLTKEEIEQWKRERKLDNDKRITKVGKILRKSSLDELPQLFNIFIGDLSIVGPRPVKDWELDFYTPYQKYMLLQCKPGLTGYWQVYGRSEAWYETGKRQTLELAYLPKRSLWFDIKLIFLTIPAVLKQKGAQ